MPEHERLRPAVDLCLRRLCRGWQCVRFGQLESHHIACSSHKCLDKHDDAQQHGERRGEQHDGRGSRGELYDYTRGE